MRNNDLNNYINTHLSSDECMDGITLQSSSYYLQDQFVEAIYNSTNDFSIISLNIQSIRAKFDQLLLFLNVLKQQNLELDMLCFQETWLNDDCDVSQFQIPNYNSHFQGKYSSQHAGLVIYVHTKYTFEPVSLPFKPSTWECLFIKLKTDGKDILIGNIYRPPKQSYCNESIRSFNTELTQILNCLNKTKSNIIVSGDFNIDALKLNERIVFKEYLTNMLSYGFLPTITLPTRISENSATLIDNIFINFHNSQINYISGTLILDISDHFPSFFSCKLTLEINKTKKYIYRRTYDKDAFNKLCTELESIDIYNLLDHNSHADPNGNYGIFENTLNSLYNKYLPVKKQKYHKYRHKNSFWITTGLMKSIKYRDKLYRSMKLLIPNSVEYYTAKNNLRVYNCILKRSIRQAKTIFYNKEFSKCKNDSKKTWKTINEVTNRISNQSFPDSMIINQNKIIDKYSIANHLNNYFGSIGSKMSACFKEDNVLFREF